MSRKDDFKRLKVQVQPDIWFDLISNRRRQGNSTAQALKLIGEAMSNPGVSVKITDKIPFQSEYNTAHHIIKNNMIPLIQNIIEMLKLEDLKINKSTFTLIYDLSWLYKDDGR